MTDHKPCDPADPCSTACDLAGLARAALAETADDGWTAWEGGECPVGPLVRVDVRFANGTSLEGEHAQTFDWDADDDEAIVAYRIVGARDE